MYQKMCDEWVRAIFSFFRPVFFLLTDGRGCIFIVSSSSPAIFLSFPVNVSSRCRLLQIHPDFEDLCVIGYKTFYKAVKALLSANNHVRTRCRNAKRGLINTKTRDDSSQMLFSKEIHTIKTRSTRSCSSHYIHSKAFEIFMTNNNPQAANI